MTGRSSDGDLVREYPAGALASAATGYLIPTYASPRGVEGGFAEELECGPREGGFSALLFGERCEATDVRVSLDVGLSREAADALNAARAPDGTPLQGAVVAMDPRDGRVLTVVSSGSYDPNCVVLPAEHQECRKKYEALVWDPNANHGRGGYRDTSTIAAMIDNAKRREDGGSGDGDRLGGLAVRHVGHPGSTFKLVTAAAGNPTGPTTPYHFTPRSTLVYGDGAVLANNLGLSCGGSLVEVIRDSCNTAFGLLGRDVGMPGIRSTATALGFAAEDAGPGMTSPPCGIPPRVGARCQVDGMAVAGSYIGFKDEFGRSCYPELAAIGQQCVFASPFQMAMVASAIGAGGVLRTPQLVTGYADAQETGPPRLRTRAPDPGRPVVSTAAAKVITDGMVAAVNGGTARMAALTCTQVAAKTGTAEVGSGGSSGTQFETDAWLVAFAPATNPVVAIAVYLEAPTQGSLSGGRDAGPVARAVLQAALRRAHVC
jgi:cell division protein FtsI/penicillin-binding protein 2